MKPKIKWVRWKQKISCLPGGSGTAKVGWTPHRATEVCFAHKWVDKMVYELSGLRVVCKIRGTNTFLYGWSLLVSQIMLDSSELGGKTFVSPIE